LEIFNHRQARKEIIDIIVKLGYCTKFQEMFSTFSQWLGNGYSRTTEITYPFEGNASKESFSEIYNKFTKTFSIKLYRIKTNGRLLQTKLPNNFDEMMRGFDRPTPTIFKEYLTLHFKCS